MNLIKKFFPYILILVLSIFSYKPLFQNGLFPVHDNTQVSRVYEMAKSLTDGMIPVRWVSDLGFGYGYPIFNFYAPLAYYVGAIINLLGLNPLDATKLMMIFGILISAFSMYILAKEFFGKFAAVVSSLLYLYAPYHAVNIYVRGAVAEFWAYAFLPLIFWGLYKVYKNENFKYITLTSIFVALTVISHNLTAFIIIPFVFIYLLFLYFKKRNIRIFFPLVIGIALSAFYWLPAFFEMRFTNVASVVGGGSDFRDHFVCLWQLWTGPWGFGGSAPGCTDGISFMIGKLHILIALLGVVFSFIFYFLKQFDKEKLKTLLLFFIFGLLAIFFMSSYSRFIWEAIPFMAYIQFPWRFLSVTAFSFSFVAGSFFYILKNKLDKNIYIFLSLISFFIIVLFYSKLFVPQRIIPVSMLDFTSPVALSWNISKISSEYMPGSFSIPKDISQTADINSIQKQGVVILSYTKKTQRINLNLLLDKKQQVTIPLAYFPAWKAFVNGKEVKITEANSGIKISLPAGKVRLELVFVQTPLEKSADIISLAGILVLSYAIIKKPK